jgi:hypothetical protein
MKKAQIEKMLTQQGFRPALICWRVKAMPVEQLNYIQ